MKFVLFHGAFGSPEGNWLPELKEKLEALGQEVVVPGFPVEDWGEITKKGPKTKIKNQTLVNWLKVFEKVKNQFKPGEELCFVGHSLGPLFILHVVEKYNLKLDSAIFVSPFLRKLNRQWQIDLVNDSFYKSEFNFNKLRELIPVSYVLYSDNDPYVDKSHSISFGKMLKSSMLYVKQAGHMNTEVSLNEFPLVLELCKTRMDLSLYQKYLAHRRELYAIDYISPKSEEVVYLEPHEVFDEGVFKFRNLKKSGFCTFDTKIDFWDTQSGYYQQARLAAKRIKNFIRVFMVDKLKDLEKDNLRQQIKLDVAAEIKVYLCLIKEVKDKIGELDFGVWDEEYLCVVRLKENKYVEVKLSSRKQDINDGLAWKAMILKHAIVVKDTDRDIAEFVKIKS
jgi:predicted alpha/beta hydrolase family esterase